MFLKDNLTGFVPVVLLEISVRRAKWSVVHFDRNAQNLLVGFAAAGGLVRGVASLKEFVAGHAHDHDDLASRRMSASGYRLADAIQPDVAKAIWNLRGKAARRRGGEAARSACGQTV